MKRFMIALTALALSACGASERPTSAGAIVSAAIDVAAKADTVVLTAERGFAVAELAYITAADGARRLAENGVLRGATATRLRTLNADAREWLIKGKAAGDKAAKAAAAAKLLAIAADIDVLKGAH